jgi:hypothetical protein
MRKLFKFIFGAATGFALALATPSDVAAQMTPILRSNISAATAPNYGCDLWDHSLEGRSYRYTRLPAASPSGSDAMRVTAIDAGDSGQVGFGCAFNQSLEPSPPQGAVRYARWRLRFPSPINWTSNYPTPGANSAGGKMFILGNSCERDPYMPTRIILTNQATGVGRNTPHLMLAQNIGPQTGWLQVNANQWLNVQIRITSSTTATRSDGRLDLYINNNNQGSPTGSVTGVHIKTAGWGRTAGCGDSFLLWGSGAFNVLATGGTYVQDMADFEYDDQFDPNWNIGGASGSGPAPPYNLRILSSLAPFGVLGFALRRRKKISHH